MPSQRKDFQGIFKALRGKPATIRLLDPPLHEFLPHDAAAQRDLAKKLGVPLASIKKRVEDLHEFNPMLGHRGCRLGISYPEITEMQATAILEASANLMLENVPVFPEIMIPLVGSAQEFENQNKIIQKCAKAVNNKHKIKLKYKVGAMIELPRACIIADQIAKQADFLSFGTNDLTQTTYGFSRDDVSGLLNDYMKKSILDKDPFISIDMEGVGQLIKIAVKKAKTVNSDIKIGICGEHGGDPKSIEYFYKLGIDYVSCSPYRVPISILTTSKFT